ncbi:MAG: hypothetical protein QM711_07475 [Micropruina sp.]|uniref:hypothetical protein n=1 Tax=Micropruina sp. TaxID=2737536 RepID=UPI0039E5355C
MTRDLLIVSERALTASDLAAGVSAAHQGRPWQVTGDGDRLSVIHCDQPLLQVQLSVPVEDPGEVAELVPGRDQPVMLWRTELSVVGEQLPLGLDVARAVAWEAGGTLVELPQSP